MRKLVISPAWRGHKSRNNLLGVAVAAALTLPQTTAAMDFDLGRGDLSFRWDNTIRVNVQDRVSGQNKSMLDNPNYDDGDRNFAVGTKFERFDILSEADFVWTPSWGALGARVSAAGWWNPGYASLDNTSVQTSNHLDESGVPVLGLPGYTKRYAEGASGEFLDWFLFSKFNVGSAPVNVKLGQTTVFWGESLYFNGAIHGIAYSQNPLDVWKGLETPGAEAKELFRPRLGFNIQSQVADDVSVAAQYFFNWQQFSNQAWRYPDSGSYLSVGDPALWGADSYIAAPNPLAPPGNWLRLWRGKDITPDENSGNFGLAVRWSPEWSGGTIGFYYRRTYDMQPQLMATPDLISGVPGAECSNVLHGAALPGASCLLNPGSPVNPSSNYYNLVHRGRMGYYNAAFGSDIDMYGLSISRNVASLSLGAELNYRRNMPLLSEAVYVLPAALVSSKPGSIANGSEPSNDSPGAKGDTLHGLVNLVGVLSKSIWDTASWGTELTWMRWLDVTQNKDVFKGRKGYDLVDAVDKNYFGLAFNFTPTWFQVRPGMDVLAPLSWSQGIYGNSAITAGGQRGAGSFGLGIALDFYQKYRFDLKYVGFYGRTQNCNTIPETTNPVTGTRSSYIGTCGVDPTTGAQLTPNAAAVLNGTNAIVSDRDFIALTFKTTF